MIVNGYINITLSVHTVLVIGGTTLSRATKGLHRLRRAADHGVAVPRTAVRHHRLPGDLGVLPARRGQRPAEPHPADDRQS